MHIHLLGQRKNLLHNTNTQMCHFKVIPLQQFFAPSFPYLHIIVSGQRNHSLSHQSEGHQKCKAR